MHMNLNQINKDQNFKKQLKMYKFNIILLYMNKLIFLLKQLEKMHKNKYQNYQLI